MRNEAEDHVRTFYSTVGWKEAQGITEDARQFEDLRECAKEYVSKCRLRVLRHIPTVGDMMLDMASGPIQYPEYLEYSRAFAKRYCVDLSQEALDSAKSKLGGHGLYLCGSFFDLELDPDTFDCAISLHTIYHMDRSLQEQAVRKMLRLCKPSAPVVIVYSNSGALLPRLKRLLRPSKSVNYVSSDNGLYFFAHPIDWWNRFSDQADVRIYPWRSLGSNDQKRLIPDNRLGRSLLSLLYIIEDAFPRFFVRYFQYPMIVLTKR